MPPQTLAQKLIARAAGADTAQPGDVVRCRVDLACLDAHIAHRAAALLAGIGAPLHDRRRIALVVEDDAADARHARAWARAEALPGVHDGSGTARALLPRSGRLRPGLFTVARAAQHAAGGAVGAYVLGIGNSDMAAVLATGSTWIEVPQTAFHRWIGRLNDGVGARDMVLATRGRFGPHGAADAVVEYTGEAVAALDVEGRALLADFSTEFGAQAGLVAPDAATRAWLEAHGADIDELGLARWHSDEDAPGVRHVFDASALAPQVALPDGDGDGDADVRPVGDLGDTAIDAACIGACSGAGVDELRAAARVLAGFRIAGGVRLLVAPASRHDAELAARDGILHLLAEAGATLLPAAAGAAALAGAGSAISSTSFATRGDADGVQLYLGSAATVAASALRGRITDPREVLR